MNHLQTNLELAQKALVYARSQIVHGSTQVENNDLAADYFEVLDEAVFEQVRPLIEQHPSDPFNLLPDYLYIHKNTLEKSSKYSLGNCYELTTQALDYLITIELDPSIDAEIFEYDDGIGDHVFLVIGRDPNSDENDITSWGEHAVICDPWANAVFAASEYEGKLKTFYRKTGENGEKKNMVHDYNPRIHKLMCTLSMNDILKDTSVSSIPTLLDKYDVELNLIYQALIEYKNKLQTISDSVIKKHGAYDAKNIILNRKIESIDPILEYISLKNSMYIAEENDFWKLHKQLYENLVNILALIKKNLILNTIEDVLISNYRNPNSILTQAQKFFKIPASTQRALEEANDQLAKRINPKK